MTETDVLLSRLPEEARTALRRALDAGPKARTHDDDVKHAFAAVAFPMPELPGWPVYELASSLTEAQRALAALGSSRGAFEKCCRGSLEIRTLAGAAGEPLYDALLYMGDAGTIFRTGTKDVAADVIQFGVHLTKPDPALRAALQLAIDTRSASKKPARAKPGGKKRR